MAGNVEPEVLLQEGDFSVCKVGGSGRGFGNKGVSGQARGALEVGRFGCCIGQIEQESSLRVGECGWMVKRFLF